MLANQPADDYPVPLEESYYNATGREGKDSASLIDPGTPAVEGGRIVVVDLVNETVRRSLRMNRRDNLRSASESSTVSRLAILTLIFIPIIHVGLLLGIIWQSSPTTDEIDHVQAGVSYWQIRMFHMYHVNPPLAKMLAAAPILVVRPNIDYEHVTRDNVPESFDFVRLARLSGIGWSLLGAWVIFRWSCELYGPLAGCLGVALWCFEPSVLAHASLATPDIPATVAGLVATYGYWRYLRAPSWPMAILVGVLLGIAQITKFTLLALYGVWPVLWLVHRLGQDDRTRRTGLRLLLAEAILILFMSIWVINIAYGLQGTWRSLGEYGFVSKSFSSAQRFVQRWFGDPMIPLPTEYLAGIDDQRRGFEVGQPSYLGGRWKDSGGWWYYYLYALAVKEPLGLWVLACWNVGLILTRRVGRTRWRDEATLWIPALTILAMVSSQTGFSKHMRYVLPMFPYVFISTGKLAGFLHRDSWRRGLLVSALLLWDVGSSLAIYPHSLSYFNEAAGGPENGHAHLLESNIDWGQDLLFLKRWLDAHPEARPIGLALYQSVDPRKVGIEFSLAPPGPDRRSLNGPQASSQCGPLPGYYAVSVNHLRGKLFPAPDGQGGWAWIKRHDYFTYFQYFRPIARAGYSIYIYRITREEANVVRRRMGLPPLPEGPSQQRSSRG